MLQNLYIIVIIHTPKQFYEYNYYRNIYDLH